MYQVCGTLTSTSTSCSNVPVRYPSYGIWRQQSWVRVLGVLTGLQRDTSGSEPFIARRTGDRDGLAGRGAKSGAVHGGVWGGGRGRGAPSRPPPPRRHGPAASHPGDHAGEGCCAAAVQRSQQRHHYVRAHTRQGRETATTAATPATTSGKQPRRSPSQGARLGAHDAPHPWIKGAENWR